jgi:hypothetical protein
MDRIYLTLRPVFVARELYLPGIAEESSAGDKS